MAINRFSQIVNPPEWVAPVPVDLVLKAMEYKQQLFDQNVQIVDSAINQHKSLSKYIMNDQAQQIYNDKIKKFTDNINNNFAYADISNASVLGAIDQQMGDLTNDPTLIGMINKSKSIRQDMERMDKLKKDGSELYDDTHANSFYLDINNFRTSKVEDALTMSSPTYQDYYDVSKEEQELIKNFKPNKIKKSTILPGARILVEEDESTYADQLQAYLEANLSDKAKKELAFQGEYRYKLGYKYEKDPQRRQMFFNETFNSYQEAMNSSIKSNQTMIEGLEQQKLKLDKKDPEYTQKIGEIDAQIQKYNAAINNKNTQLQNIQKDPAKFLNDISQTMYINSHINNKAVGNQVKRYSATYEVDQAYVDMLNYNLDVQTFLFDQKKWDQELEFKWAELGYKKDKNGNLVQLDVFGFGGGMSNLAGHMDSGTGLAALPGESNTSQVIRDIETKAAVAKNNIEAEYYRVWEKEAAGSNGFFTSQQKAKWNEMTDTQKREYFKETVLPYYTKLSEGSKTSVMVDGKKVTRDASYVPSWFKQMKSNPAYESTYMALQVGSQFREKLGANFKQYEGKITGADGKKLNAAEIVEMAELQTYLEDEIVSVSDFSAINNLIQQVENYKKSNGASTREEGFWGAVEGVYRDIMPGESFNTEDIAKLARRFGGIDNLQKVVKNLYHNTDEGTQLSAFGGEALRTASVGATVGTGVGTATGLLAGGVGAIPGAGLGFVGGGAVGFTGGLISDVINLFRGDSNVDFDDIGDEAREAISSITSKMSTVNQPYFTVTNKESKQYKNVIKPQAIQIANAAMAGSRMNPFTMNPDNYDYEGVSAGGEMVFSYKNMSKAEFETFQQMVGSNSSISYDGESNSFRVKVDPQKIGALNNFTQMYEARALNAAGLLTSMPRREIAVRNPSTGKVKIYDYQLLQTDKGVQLAFYRDDNQIVIPNITKAESAATNNSVMPITDLLGADLVGADAAMKAFIQQQESVKPGYLYNQLDKLIQYAENNY